MGVWRRLAMATVMKIPSTTAVIIHLRLRRTRMYSRIVDSCDGVTLYSVEPIGLRNSAGSPGCSSRNPSLLRGTRGPNDIITPQPPQARCDSAPHPNIQV